MKVSCRAQPVVKSDDRLLEVIEKEIRSFLPVLSPISSPVHPENTPAKSSVSSLISEPHVAISIVLSPGKSKDLLAIFLRAVPVDLSLLATGTHTADSELQMTYEEIGQIF